MSAKNIPFKNLNADAWRKIALAAVALMYLLNFINLFIIITTLRTRSQEELT
jgi:hypothetical protein